MALDDLPGVAEVAMQSGIHAARTIKKRVEGGAEPKPFKYRDLGSMAAVSRRRAIVSFHGVRVSGFLGWLMWLAVHLTFMTGFKNRFTAALAVGLQLHRPGPSRKGASPNAARRTLTPGGRGRRRFPPSDRRRTVVVTSTPEASLSGAEIIDTPTLNKGTAFTEEERRALGLQGLLPPHVETLDEQVVRAYEAYERQDDDLERHVYLRDLQDTNEVLFYRLLLDHVVEMLPIVYTPVGRRRAARSSATSTRTRAACSSRTRTATTSARSLRNRPNAEVDVIVVTDGERILGHRRPGRRRPRHPDRQALALLADRRHPPRADAADRARRRHQQPGAARRSRVPRLAPRARHRRRTTTTSSTRSSQAVKEELPERLPAVGGLREHARPPAPRALPRRAADVQRRHPGHRRRSRSARSSARSASRAAS